MISRGCADHGLSRFVRCRCPRHQSFGPNKICQLISIGNPGLAHVGYGSGSLPREPQLEIHGLREIEGLFRGEFAMAHRQDARRLLQITVADPDERELLIRMSLAIGAFTMEDIAAVARVPQAIRLPGEKVQSATGVWLQQVGKSSYLRSPLITSALADSLGSGRRETECISHLRCGY